MSSSPMDRRLRRHWPPPREEATPTETRLPVVERPAGARAEGTDGRTDGRDRVQAEDSPLSLPLRSTAAPLARRHQTVWRPLPLPQRRAAAAPSVWKLRPSRSPSPRLPASPLDLISPLEAASSAAGRLAGWQAAGGEYFFPLRIHNPERERVSSRTKFHPVAASIIDRSSDSERERERDEDS